MYIYIYIGFGFLLKQLKHESFNYTISLVYTFLNLL